MKTVFIGLIAFWSVAFAQLLPVEEEFDVTIGLGNEYIWKDHFQLKVTGEEPVQAIMDRMNVEEQREGSVRQRLITFTKRSDNALCQRFYSYEDGVLVKTQAYCWIGINKIKTDIWPKR